MMVALAVFVVFPLSCLRHMREVRIVGAGASRLSCLRHMSEVRTREGRKGGRWWMQGAPKGPRRFGLG